MEPWIFHLSQQLQLEDKDLKEFKEIIIEAKKIEKITLKDLIKVVCFVFNNEAL